MSVKFIFLHFHLSFYFVYTDYIKQDAMRLLLILPLTFFQIVFLILFFVRCFCRQTTINSSGLFISSQERKRLYKNHHHLCDLKWRWIFKRGSESQNAWNFVKSNATQNILNSTRLRQMRGRILNLRNSPFFHEFCVRFKWNHSKSRSYD